MTPKNKTSSDILAQGSERIDLVVPEETPATNRFGEGRTEAADKIAGKLVAIQNNTSTVDSNNRRDLERGVSLPDSHDGPPKLNGKR